MRYSLRTGRLLNVMPEESTVDRMAHAVRIAAEVERAKLAAARRRKAKA